MTNKTAVDSIIEFCEEQMYREASVHQIIYLSIIKFCKEQSKPMEKEQIIEAFEIGIQSEFFHQTFHAPCKDGEQYYNETYTQ